MCISLVTADEKCWESEQIAVEIQDNHIAFEVVTNECSIWVVPHCNAFITQGTAIWFGQAISQSCFPSVEVTPQTLNACPCPLNPHGLFLPSGTKPKWSSGRLHQRLTQSQKGAVV